MPKSSEFVDTGPRHAGDSDTEDTLRAMSFSIDKLLEAGKNKEELVIRKGIYRSKKLSYVAKLYTSYPYRVFKERQENKRGS